MKRIEDFRKSFNKAMIDLDAFTESLQELKTMRPTEISDILKRRSGTNIEMQNIVKMIIKNGKRKILNFYESAIPLIVKFSNGKYVCARMCACVRVCE